MWKTDYAASEQRTAQWGVCDEITFNTLYDLTATLPSPYLIGYSTLSSHAPWDVPIHEFDDEVLNAFHYLDQCLGRTLLVLLPDHGIPYKDIDERHPLMNHIPMLWLGGVVREPRRIQQVCNQTDLPATLLAQLGLPHREFTFSRDVLSRTYTEPFAINTYTEGFSLVDSTSYVNYDLIGRRVCAEQGQGKPELVQRGKAILQAASKDLDQR